MVKSSTDILFTFLFAGFGQTTSSAGLFGATSNQNTGLFGSGGTTQQNAGLFGTSGGRKSVERLGNLGSKQNTQNFGGYFQMHSI